MVQPGIVGAGVIEPTITLTPTGQGGEVVTPYETRDWKDKSMASEQTNRLKTESEREGAVMSAAFLLREMIELSDRLDRIEAGQVAEQESVSRTVAPPSPASPVS